MTERDRKFGQKMAHKMCRFFVLEKSTLIYERHRDKGWAPVAGVSEMETRVVGIPRVAPPVPASGCCGVSDPPCVPRYAAPLEHCSPFGFADGFPGCFWKTNLEVPPPKPLRPLCPPYMYHPPTLRVSAPCSNRPSSSGRQRSSFLSGIFR